MRFFARFSPFVLLASASSVVVTSVAPTALVMGSFFFVAATFSSCSGKPVDENNPEQMLADAEEDIKSDHFQIGLDKLRAIKNRFPYSKQAVDAQLRIADVYFMQEAYGEAALAYESFKDLHPKHEKTPYAMYRLALSHYNDIPSTVARDMTSAKKALEAYQAFLAKFPNAPEAADAKKSVVDVRRKLAEKEMYIGYFYFRRDYFKTARRRYERVLEEYPDTFPVAEAKDKIAKIDQFIREGKGENEEDSVPNKNQNTRGINTPPNVFAPGSSTP